MTGTEFLIDRANQPHLTALEHRYIKEIPDPEPVPVGGVFEPLYQELVAVYPSIFAKANRGKFKSRALLRERAAMKRQAREMRNDGGQG